MSFGSHPGRNVGLRACAATGEHGARRRAVGRLPFWLPIAVGAILALFGSTAATFAREVGPKDAAAPAPPQNLAASPATWSNTDAFALTWNDPSGSSPIVGAWYKLDTAPSGPHDGIFVQTSQHISGIAPANDGAHMVYVWLQDAQGRVDQTHAATTTLYVDRTPPPPPSGLSGNPARTWTNSNRFAESWVNPPDMSGIAGVYYRINRPGQFPTDGTFVSTTNTLENIAVPSDGKHDLYIWLVDRAGNVDQNSRNIDPQVFWYDSTPPASNVTLDPAPSASGWYSTPVTITFSATDGSGGSGVAAVMHKVDDTNWSSLPSVQLIDEGVHQVSYYALDVAGNAEPTGTLTVALDLTPPVTTVSADRAPEASGWYTAPVTFKITVKDSLSDRATGRYRLNDGEWQSGNEFTISAEGEYDVSVYGQDGAGNRSTTQYIHVKMDGTPPSTAYLIEGTQSQNGWYTSPLTVRLIATDGGSGVAATYYRINNGVWQNGTQLRLDTDGTYSLAFYSVDKAGNVESSFPVQVKLDTAAPTAPTAVQTQPSGWSRQNRFVVQWANPTDLSGIAGVYYKLDQEPAGPSDGTFSPLTNRLDMAVPSEGTHRLYLWLRDNAGNADQRNRAVTPPLLFDATAPTTTLQIEGLAGTEGWYRSPVTLTLDAVDGGSGVTSTRYRLDGGNWVTGTMSVLTEQGKHLFDYTSADAAGNAEPLHQLTLRVDTQAPPAPINPRAMTTGWQHTNSFSLAWQDPLDLSGIAGALIRYDRAPTGPDDETFYPAAEVLQGLQVPGEGKHDLYIWLRDRAGNSDPRTVVALPAALWYDGSPPATAVTITGTLGHDGWYLGPVRFSMSATDEASGVQDIRWQLDGGSWTAGRTFTVDQGGHHVVRIASSDNAGNVEASQVYQINIDQTPPATRMGSLDHHQMGTRFEVNWSGYDPDPASGLVGYDVQMREGFSGQWTNWLLSTQMTSATFNGVRGHSYFFRVRARDVAGNQSAWTGADAYTVIDAIRNGSFDTGNFTDWSTSGLLRKAVVPADGPGGISILAARLGTPEYGPSTQEPGQVPVGNAAVVQAITIPSLGQVRRPTLTFWYRVYSYDVLFSQRLQRYVDDLEVSLLDTSGKQVAVLMREGNPTNNYGALYDSGWRVAMLDLSRFAGQTLQLMFANYNREDNLFNTWSFLDNIQVQDWPFNQSRYLPLVAAGGPASGTGQIPPSTPESAGPSAGFPPVTPEALPAGKR